MNTKRKFHRLTCERSKQLPSKLHENRCWSIMDLEFGLKRNYCFDYYNYYINRIRGLAELRKTKTSE
jgi:hypothetical protein